MWWLVALLAILALCTVFDLTRRRPPILLLVRGREDDVEGVVRRLAGRGRPLFLLCLEPDGVSAEIAQRLSRSLPEVHRLEGDVEDALAQCPAPVVTVVSLVGPWRPDEIFPYI